MRDIKISFNNIYFFFESMKNLPFFEFAKISFFKNGIEVPVIENFYEKIDFKFKDYESYLSSCKKRVVLPFSTLETSLYNGKFISGKLKINYPDDRSLIDKISPQILKGGSPHHLHLTISDRRNFYSPENVWKTWENLKEESDKFDYLLNRGFVHIYGPYTCGSLDENTNVHIEIKNNLMEFSYHEGDNLNIEQKKVR